MRKIGILLATMVLICTSCDKTDGDPKFSGEIILSSEILQSGQDYAFYGFSFETGKISIYSLTGSATPDLALTHVELQDSVNIVITSSNDLDAFYKSGIFSNATEAEAYFNNYNEVIAMDFQPLAKNIRKNQIWTVKTESKRFAKIWIKEITVKTGSLSDYADVKVQYEYQPDGSRSFDCDCN